MVVLRFSNESTKAIDLIVEPWATTVSIPAGARFAVHYPPPADGADESYTEIYDGMVRFQCEGDTFEVEIDGALVET